MLRPAVSASWAFDRPSDCATASTGSLPPLPDKRPSRARLKPEPGALGSEKPFFGLAVTPGPPADGRGDRRGLGFDAMQFVRNIRLFIWHSAIAWTRPFPPLQPVVPSRAG